MADDEFRMPETPRNVSKKIDQILDRLNGSWDLQLPHLHGRSAQIAETAATTIALRCFSRIRYLCYGPGYSGIDNTIEEFESRAQVALSEWVFKPSQEDDTLPSIPLGQSFLKRDILGKRARSITPKLRESLLELLFSFLDDEFKLAHESKHYERISSQEPFDRPSRTPSFQSAASGPSRCSEQMSSEKQHKARSSVSTSSKRRKTSGETQDGKRSKSEMQRPSAANSRNQMSDYFRSSKRDTKSSSQLASSSTTNLTKLAQQDEDISEQLPQEFLSSFDTNASRVPRVFSRTNSDSSFTSNDTSFIGSQSDLSQDYLPSQDGRDTLADETVQLLLKSFDSTLPQPVFAFDDLNATTPFRGFDPLPEGMNFWLRWEIYRLAQTTELPASIFQGDLERQHTKSSPTYEQFWATATAICKKWDKPIPAKSDVRSWMEQTGNYESPEGQTAYFTISLIYNRESGPYLWKLVLNPIQVDKSNRIHRKYGADRHVTCYLEYFDKSRLPKWVTKSREFVEAQAHRSITTWLSTETHNLAGRQWRAFFLEQEKSKSRRSTSQAPRQKLHLFATSGIDLIENVQSSSRSRVALSIEKFLNWHIPLQHNLDSTDVKLFSRWGPGLSKTRSTVILEPHQFRHPEVETDMNDGCALMSVGMGKAVWEICGDGSHDVPSAFQGRTSGAKGLWIIDYRSGEIDGDLSSIWINVSEHQLKIKPHPRIRLDADETQRSFEVLKWSKPCKPGHLNIQLINILADRGVSRSVLAQLVHNDLEEYIEASRGAMREPMLLQAWLQDYHSGERREQPASFAFGLPETLRERVAYLSQSGFNAGDCKFLRDGIRQLMKQELETYVDKLRIVIPHSTSTFCVPDPYDVLEEDEVYLGFSNYVENPKTGLKEIALEGIEVLVARNPAHLASDIQKRKAVYKRELRHFKDIIVFPSKGTVPLASLLSGGDYDGDTVTVMWDPELVNNFRNAEKPELPSEELCGLQKVSQKLSDIIPTLPASREMVNKFFTSCIAFNSSQSVLGMCTTEHEKLIYNGVKLSDQGAVMLATLAGYLVDASKQGLLMDHQALRKACSTASKGRAIHSMAYKSAIDNPRRLNKECVNIVDYLKTDVAKKRMDDVLEEFEKLFNDNQNEYDTALAKRWKDEDDRTRDGNDPEREAVGDVLRDLKQKLRELHNAWQLRSNKRKPQNGPMIQQQYEISENDFEHDDRSVDIRYMSGLLDDITPLKTDCDIYRDFLREQRTNTTNPNSIMKTIKGSRWSLLRASAMYSMTTWRFKSIMWSIVGDELGRIKARSLGATRELTPAMHNVLKADCKLIKRLVGSCVDSDEDDDMDG